MAVATRQDYDLATASPLPALPPGLPAPQLGDLRRYASGELYAGWYLADPQQRSVFLLIHSGPGYLLLTLSTLPDSRIQPSPHTKMPSKSSRRRSRPTSTRHHGCSGRAPCETSEMRWCRPWRNTRPSPRGTRFKNGFQVALGKSCTMEVGKSADPIAENHFG